MKETRQTARGVAWNWVALVFGIAVTFFLSPFIVRHLGNVAYGVWTLVVSLTSYMSLLDLGLRGAVVRFVAQHHAQRRHDDASRAVSAALWLRQWIGAAVIAVSVLFSVGVNHFFRIPVNLQFATKWAIVLTGTTLALTLIGGVFSGVLAALHRFDLISGITIAQTSLRAAGVFWLLKTGHGILALALWECVAATACNIALAGFSFRVYGQLRIYLHFPEREILRQYWSYSSYVVLMQIFGQIVYYSDNLVIGALFSVTAVAFYAIGGSLSEYVRQVLMSLTATFMPLASRFEATNQKEKLRQLLIQGTRIALTVALPIQVVLFFRGPTFINLWMGKQYGPVSGRVLQILLVSQIFQAANSTTINLVLGLGKHRRTARWGAGEAVANLALSIFLAGRFGIYGVAIGTVIPSLFVQIVLWPRLICPVVDMPLRQHYWSSWIRAFMPAVPFAVACYLTDKYWHVTHLTVFFLQVAAVMPLYVLAVVVCFWKDISWYLSRRTSSFIRGGLPGEGTPGNIPQVTSSIGSP